MYMRKLSAYNLILLSSILPSVTQASDSQTTYTKDASQFCFTKLSADEQIRNYSRIMNIGAS
ncbi:MAG: hypothetical protein RJB13_1563, partial [Pseudomonadota bacterium]